MTGKEVIIIPEYSNEHISRISGRWSYNKRDVYRVDVRCANGRAHGQHRRHQGLVCRVHDIGRVVGTVQGLLILEKMKNEVQNGGFTFDTLEIVGFEPKDDRSYDIVYEMFDNPGL